MSSPFMGSWRAAPECPPHLWGVGVQRRNVLPIYGEVACSAGMSSPFMGSWRAAPECPPHLWGGGVQRRNVLPIYGELACSAGMSSPFMGRWRAAPEGLKRTPISPSLVMLGGLGLQRRILSGALPRVAADHPPTETDNAQPGDQERHAHPEPGGNPFTGENDHGPPLSPTDDLRPLRAGRVLPVKAVDQPHRHPDPDCHRRRARQRIPARILALPRPIRGF